GLDREEIEDRQARGPPQERLDHPTADDRDPELGARGGLTTAFEPPVEDPVGQPPGARVLDAPDPGRRLGRRLRGRRRVAFARRLRVVLARCLRVVLARCLRVVLARRRGLVVSRRWGLVLARRWGLVRARDLSEGRA